MKESNLSAVLIPFGLSIVMILWGGAFVAIKIALRYLTPMELVMARFIPSAICLVPLGIWTYRRRTQAKLQKRKLSRKEIAAWIWAALCSVPIYHFCLNKGETYIPAGWSSLVIALNPACITILAAILLKETIGFRRWLGILFALSGLVFIALSTNALDESGYAIPTRSKLLGIIITLGAVTSWGFFTVFSKKLMNRLPPFTVLAGAMGIGTLTLLPLVDAEFIDIMSAGNIELWGAVLYLSLGCTVLAFVIWFWALNRWYAARAGAFIYFVPLIALAGGRVFLNEPLGLTILFGTALVLGGVILAVQRQVS